MQAHAEAEQANTFSFAHAAGASAATEMPSFEASDARILADLMHNELCVAKGELMQKLNEIAIKLDEPHRQISKPSVQSKPSQQEQFLLPIKLDGVTPKKESAASSIKNASSSPPLEMARQTSPGVSQFPTESSGSGTGSSHPQFFISGITKSFGNLVRSATTTSAWMERDHRRAAAKESVAAMSRDTSEFRSTWMAEAGCGPCRALLRYPGFDACVAIMILINVIFIGIEVEFTATLHQNEIPALFTWANIGFTLFFLTELTVRLIGMGPLVFFFGRDWFWSNLDTVLVASSLLELAFLMLQASAFETSQFRAFRIMRVARTVRGIRVVRVVKFASSLRTLLFSIVNTLRSLMWTLVLLCLIFYGFGVVLTQVIVDFCREEKGTSDGTLSHLQLPPCSSAGLAMHWSSLARSMYTLFKSISGGISWHDVVTPLAEVSGFAVACFLIFLTFTYFAVLNVVTGVFCQSAIEAASLDKDIAVQTQLQQRDEYTKQFRDIFKEVDQDASDQITQDELEKKFEEYPRLLAYFDSLGINASDAWSLFKLLDIDYSGCIDIDEFAAGCLNLRGPAKAVQMAKMSYENKIQRSAVLDMERTLNAMLKQLQPLLQAMASQMQTASSSACQSSGRAAAVRIQQLQEQSDGNGFPSESSCNFSQPLSSSSKASSEVRMQV